MSIWLVNTYKPKIFPSEDLMTTLPKCLKQTNKWIKSKTDSLNNNKESKISKKKSLKNNRKRTSKSIKPKHKKPNTRKKETTWPPSTNGKKKSLIKEKKPEIYQTLCLKIETLKRDNNNKVRKVEKEEITRKEVK